MHPDGWASTDLAITGQKKDSMRRMQTTKGWWNEDHRTLIYGSRLSAKFHAQRVYLYLTWLLWPTLFIQKSWKFRLAWLPLSENEVVECNLWPDVPSYWHKNDWQLQNRCVVTAILATRSCKYAHAAVGWRFRVSSWLHSREHTSASKEMPLLSDICPCMQSILTCFRRLQELEEEVAALKRQQQSTSPVQATNPLPGWDGNAQPGDSGGIVRDPAEGTGVMRLDASPTDQEPTMWRTIDGLEVSPGIIDDCFKR